MFHAVFEQDFIERRLARLVVPDVVAELTEVFLGADVSDLEGEHSLVARLLVVDESREDVHHWFQEAEMVFDLAGDTTWRGADKRGIIVMLEKSSFPARFVLSVTRMHDRNKATMCGHFHSFCRVVKNGS